MPRRKKKNRRSLRKESNGIAGRKQKGVCAMCGYNSYVIPMSEFDDQPLCNGCMDETITLKRYVERDNPWESEDDLFFDG